MAVERSYTSLGASAKDLDIASRDRLDDADALARAGRHAQAIALALYALEVRLKERICVRLDLRQLPRAFEVHDLKGLLLLSGLSRKINNRQSRHVKKNWNEIAKVAEKINDLRYKPASGWGQKDAADLLDKLTHPEHGVLTWISTQD